MICIIPARGGSERLAGKNIIDFFGMPIIYHVIKTCKQAGIFDTVTVSTDDEEIADIVDAFFCDVHFRPDHLQGDVPEAEVLIDCAKYYNEQLVCRVYPFAALLTMNRLLAGYALFTNSEYDAIMECQKYGHPPQRGFTLDGYTGRYLKGENVEKRTQDLKSVYHDAGTYMYTSNEALKKPLAEQDIGWIKVDEMDAQDIDTYQDLQLARAKFLMREYRK